MPRKTINETMNGREFAALCDVSPDTVSRWCKEGMPHTGGGRSGWPLKINVRQALPWLDRTRRHSSEQERLTAERADSVALENVKARRGLVKREHVEQVTARLVAGLNFEDAFPDEVCQQIAAAEDPALVRSVLQSRVRQIRNDYVKTVEAAGGR